MPKARDIIEGEDPKDVLRRAIGQSWTVKRMDNTESMATLYHNNQEIHNLSVNAHMPHEGSGDPEVQRQVRELTALGLMRKNNDQKYCDELQAYLRWLELKFPCPDNSRWVPGSWLKAADAKGFPEKYTMETGKAAYKAEGNVGLMRVKLTGYVEESEDPKGVFQQLPRLHWQPRAFGGEYLWFDCVERPFIAFTLYYGDAPTYQVTYRRIDKSNYEYSENFTLNTPDTNEAAKIAKDMAAHHFSSMAGKVTEAEDPKSVFHKFPRTEARCYILFTKINGAETDARAKCYFIDDVFSLGNDSMPGIWVSAMTIAKALGEDNPGPGEWWETHKDLGEQVAEQIHSEVNGGMSWGTINLDDEFSTEWAFIGPAEVEDYMRQTRRWSREEALRVLDKYSDGDSELIKKYDGVPADWRDAAGGGVVEAEDPKRFLQQHGRDFSYSNDGTVYYVNPLNDKAKAFVDSVSLPCGRLEDGLAVIAPQYFQRFLALAGAEGLTGRRVQEAEDPKSVFLAAKAASQKPEAVLARCGFSKRVGQSGKPIWWLPGARVGISISPVNRKKYYWSSWRKEGDAWKPFGTVEYKTWQDVVNRLAYELPFMTPAARPEEPPVTEAEDPKDFLQNKAPRYLWRITYEMTKDDGGWTYPLTAFAFTHIKKQIADLIHKHYPRAQLAITKIVPASEREIQRAREGDLPVLESLADDIAKEAAKAEQPKSQEQADAGTQKKGHIRLHGWGISIENAKGSVRKSKDPKNPWQVTMPAHYGYIKGTVGKDKDHIDVYIGEHPSSILAFVVNQVKKEGGAFDEHKVMLGFKSKDEAIETYDKAFTGDLGPKLRKDVISCTIDQLKHWLDKGDPKKEFAILKEAEESRAEAESFSLGFKAVRDTEKVEWRYDQAAKRYRFSKFWIDDYSKQPRVAANIASQHQNHFKLDAEMKRWADGGWEVTRLTEAEDPKSVFRQIARPCDWVAVYRDERSGQRKKMVIIACKDEQEATDRFEKHKPDRYAFLLQVRPYSRKLDEVKEDPKTALRAARMNKFQCPSGLLTAIQDCIDELTGAGYRDEADLMQVFKKAQLYCSQMETPSWEERKAYLEYAEKALPRLRQNEFVIQAEDLEAVIETLCDMWGMEAPQRPDFVRDSAQSEARAIIEAEDPKDFLKRLAPGLPSRTVKIYVLMRDGTSFQRRIPVAWEKARVMKGDGWYAGINLHGQTPAVAYLDHDEWEDVLSTVEYHIMDGPPDPDGELDYVELHGEDYDGRVAKIEWNYIGNYEGDQEKATRFFGGVVPFRRDEAEDPKEVLRRAMADKESRAKNLLHLFRDTVYVRSVPKGEPPVMLKGINRWCLDGAEAEPHVLTVLDLEQEMAWHRSCHREADGTVQAERIFKSEPYAIGAQIDWDKLVSQIK